MPCLPSRGKTPSRRSHEQRVNRCYCAIAKCACRRSAGAKGGRMVRSRWRGSRTQRAGSGRGLPAPVATVYITAPMQPALTGPPRSGAARSAQRNRDRPLDAMVPVLKPAVRKRVSYKAVPACLPAKGRTRRWPAHQSSSVMRPGTHAGAIDVEGRYQPALRLSARGPSLDARGVAEFMMQRRTPEASQERVP